jgi:surfeit locus 1 family protein
MSSPVAHRRGRLVPTLIAVPGVIVLLGLGSWQVARHFERAAQNDLRASQLAQPPVPMDRAIADPAANRFRRVEVRGTFAHERELHMYARSKNGNEGYYILTPLLRDEAPPLIVNRGWVPTCLKEPKGLGPAPANIPEDRLNNCARGRAAGQVAGIVTIDGVLRDEPRRGMLTPDNDAVGNRWFWFDLPAMAQALKLPGLLPVYVEAGPAPNPGGFPIGGQTQDQLPSNHAQYAITWFALAVALAVIFVLWLKRQKP